MLVLLQDNRSDDLKRMFQLFMRHSVPLREMPMAEVFETFVSQEGAKALSARRAELAADEAAGKKEASDVCRVERQKLYDLLYTGLLTRYGAFIDRLYGLASLVYDIFNKN